MDRINLTGFGCGESTGSSTSSAAQGQDFIVDVTLGLSLTHAALSDDVADTIHYGELASQLAAVIAGEPVNLIETLASRLVDICLADKRVAEATVTVHKPQAPIAHAFNDVSVTLHRLSSDKVARPKT